MIVVVMITGDDGLFGKINIGNNIYKQIMSWNPTSFYLARPEGHRNSTTLSFCRASSLTEPGSSSSHQLDRLGHR